MTSPKPLGGRLWSPSALTLDRGFVCFALATLSVAALAMATHHETGFWLPAAIGLIEVLAAVSWVLSRRWRWLAVNALGIGTIFVGAEAFLVWGGRPRDAAFSPPIGSWVRMREGGGSDVYYFPGLPFRRDEILGWSEKPSTETMERRYYRGRLVAAARYTTDEHGFRRVPKAIHAVGDVLLFGCSMTWGSNIDDEETYPWQLSEMMSSQVQVHNLGIPGTGPNAMLAMLEANSVPVAVSGQRKVIAAYYVAWLNRSVGHLARVLGRVPWSAESPRYRLARPPAEGVVHDGRLPTTLDQFLLKHSAVTAEIGRGLGRLRLNPNYAPEDVALLGEILVASDRQLQARLGVPLSVVILSDPGAHDLEQQLAARLAQKSIQVRTVSLPPWGTIRRDVHPNRIGAKLLAESVYADLRNRHLLPGT